MVIITTLEILHGWCGICLPEWTSCYRIEFIRLRWCHNSPSCKRVQIEEDWMKFNDVYIVVCHISRRSYKHLLKPNCSLLLYNSSTCEACLSPTPKCGEHFSPLLLKWMFVYIFVGLTDPHDKPSIFPSFYWGGGASQVLLQITANLLPFFIVA